jgi:hypothetical protein
MTQHYEILDLEKYISTNIHNTGFVYTDQQQPFSPR